MDSPTPSDPEHSAVPVLPGLRHHQRDLVESHSVLLGIGSRRATWPAAPGPLLRTVNVYVARRFTGAVEGPETLTPMSAGALTRIELVDVSLAKFGSLVLDAARTLTLIVPVKPAFGRMTRSNSPTWPLASCEVEQLTVSTLAPTTGFEHDQPTVPVSETKVEEPRVRSTVTFTLCARSGPLFLAVKDSVTALPGFAAVGGLTEAERSALGAAEATSTATASAPAATRAPRPASVPKRCLWCDRPAIPDGAFTSGVAFLLQAPSRLAASTRRARRAAMPPTRIELVHAV